VVTEISDLIAAQRAYEMNAKVVSAADRCCNPPPTCSAKGLVMIARALLLATALIAASSAAAVAQIQETFKNAI